MNDELYPDTATDAELAQFDDDFQHAPDLNLTIDTIPDGIYDTIIESVEFRHASRTGALMLSWTLRIITGPCKGQPMQRNNMMQTPDNIVWLKNDLKIAGLTVNRVSALKNHLPYLIGRKLRVKRQTRDGRNNTYFVQALAGSSNPA